MENQNNNEKKPISPLLKKLKVGECEVFPIERSESVIALSDRIQRVLNVKFSRESDTKNRTITVKRVA